MRLFSLLFILIIYARIQSMFYEKVKAKPCAQVSLIYVNPVMLPEVNPGEFLRSLFSTNFQKDHEIVP